MTKESAAHTRARGWGLPRRGDAGELSVPEVPLRACPALAAWMAPRLRADVLPALSQGVPEWRRSRKRVPAPNRAQRAF